MQRSGIINKVKVRLDEITPDDEVTHPLDALIDSLIDDASYMVCKFAPKGYFTPTQIDFAEQYVDTTNKKLYLAVPSEFVRLYKIKNDSWEYDVEDVIYEGSEAYQIAIDENVGAGKGRPVVAVIHDEIDSTFGEYFEIWPLVYESGNSVSLDTTMTGSYIKKLKPEELNERLIDALVWASVELVTQSLEKTNVAQMAQAKFSEALSLL